MMRMVPTPHAAGRLPYSLLLPLAAVLAASATLVHWELVDVRHHALQVTWHNDIIAFRGPYPDQYRILVYWLAQGLMNVGVPFTPAHEAWRFLFTALSFVVFARYLEGWHGAVPTLFGIFWLWAVLPASYLFYHMQPTDPLNTLVFFAAFLALQRGRDGWVPLLVAIGMLNRETPILIPILHAAVRVGRVPWKRWLPLVLLEAAVAVGIYAGLRIWIGYRPAYTKASFAQFWITNLTHWRAWVQIAAMFNLALWYAWRHWNARPLFLRRAAWLLPPFVLVHYSVGFVQEIRLFLPLLALAVPLTLFALRERFAALVDEPATHDDEALPEVSTGHA